MNGRALLVGFAFAASVGAQQRLPLDRNWQIVAEAKGKEAAPLPVTVPAPFETALGLGFDGIARYRVPLPLKPVWRDASIRVEFAAVATHATVSCNGVEVAQHLGGWTPFRAELTPHLKWDGNDVLEVRVDERVGHNTQGFLPVIQPHFGGIWQPVTLCVDQGPVLDRLRLFVFGHGDGRVQTEVAVLGGAGSVEVSLLDGTRVLARKTTAVTTAAPLPVDLAIAEPRLWRPGAPHLYRVRFVLKDAAGAELDQLERSTGCRDLRADGTRILWNGVPLQIRGALHWGYSPPHLAPPGDAAYWRGQLEDLRARGFNLVKCCLWVPPPCFYDLCDELGLLVWQEYPTWHPKMDAAHRQELRQEYEEFFRADRSHPSVAIRSLTCETGRSAELAVIKELFDACHAAVPGTLVVDDSSWIGWQRVTDFWDEHPYGNNSWWQGRLQGFLRHIAEHGRKPLLLGECMAGDTWADRARWDQVHGSDAHWWRPDCWAAQGPAEDWLRASFGPELLRTLGPVSRDFAMQGRKYQIERLRLHIPEAGYVVSVARDFAKARMGLVDDFGAHKWSAREFAWQGDTMLCLDLPHDRRAQHDGLRVPVRIAHSGNGPLRGRLSLRADDRARTGLAAEVAIDAGKLGNAVELRLPPVESVGPVRIRIDAALEGTHAASNHWTLWSLPPSPPRGDGAGVRTVEKLDLATLDFLEQGGRVLLLAGDRKHSLRTEGMWFLRGAPFAPLHPVHRLLPAELLLEQCAFDLESGRVMPWENLKDQVDPILAFWETHDIPQVRFHLLAFDCKVGKGRLLASCLNHESELGRYALDCMRTHLAEGPEPKRAWSGATLAAMRGLLGGQKIELPSWRFRTDPKDEGRAGSWFTSATDASVAPWRELKAGAHWEGQAEDLKHYEGVAWYRIDVEVPADWQGKDARAVFDGVDDSYVLWLNGEEIASFGDPATNKSVWLERTVAELGQRLRTGRNTIVLRVVDHQGAGGMWRPAFLTTGPAGEQSKLLH